MILRFLDDLKRSGPSNIPTAWVERQPGPEEKILGFFSFSLKSIKVEVETAFAATLGSYCSLEKGAQMHIAGRCFFFFFTPLPC